MSIKYNRKSRWMSKEVYQFFGLFFIIVVFFIYFERRRKARKLDELVRYGIKEYAVVCEKYYRYKKGTQYILEYYYQDVRYTVIRKGKYEIGDSIEIIFSKVDPDIVYDYKTLKKHKNQR